MTAEYEITSYNIKSMIAEQVQKHAIEVTKAKKARLTAVVL